MPDLMIDLETMGHSPNAAIIAVGAVTFDMKNKTLGDEFYVVVDLASAMAAGGVVDASTILWWMEQSDEARAEFVRPGKSVEEALFSFRCWVLDLGALGGVWGNGAAFDNVVLRSAYDRLGTFSAPWPFRLDRCFRTVRALHPVIEIPEVGTAHNALDDAKYQARYLMEALG